MLRQKSGKILRKARKQNGGRATTERFDEHLSFDLPSGYFAIREKDDEGKPVFRVNSGRSFVDGEAKYSLTSIISSLEKDAGLKDGAGFSLSGNVENRVIADEREINILFMTVTNRIVLICLKTESNAYLIASTKAQKPDAAAEETEEWVGFLNKVIASAVLDGTPVKLEKLTLERLQTDGQKRPEDDAADNGDIPAAKPKKGQHTHLDFLNKSRSSMSIFGGLLSVNATGTEYAMQELGAMAEGMESEELAQLCRTAAEMNAGSFELAETAEAMAELFRVDVEHFDPSHDREQEIREGYIHRAAFYDTLRSFAWTVAAFCEKENMQPAALDYETIVEITERIEARGGLNYTADSYAPALCSCDDLHVYFIPDAVPKNVSTRLKQLGSQNEEDKWEVCSLDGLRRDLEAVYPAIRTIYDRLEAERDREEALTGGTADILYAWCAVAYAARRAFFSEDGPMNCFWEHPDNQVDWELQWKIRSLEESIKRGEEWLSKYRKELSPKAPVIIRDKLFVFAGVNNLDEWLDILRKFTEMGGVERNVVSGKTDYLVCNPTYAGEAQVRHALEQRIKGKDVKIILLDDFLRAIGMKVKTPEEALSELRAQTEKKSEAKKLQPVSRPEPEKQEAPEQFTYLKGLKVRGDGYSMAIPDGFVIREGAENRDFVAYIPNEEAPDDYEMSRFIIMAGQDIRNDIFSQMRTDAEFMATIRGFHSRMDAISAGRGETYRRSEMPGFLSYVCDAGCLHLNGLFFLDGHIKMMRMQISDVERKNQTGYVEIAKKMLDRMTPEKPLRRLRELDADEFLSMRAEGAQADAWVACVNEHAEHLASARNIEQNLLVATFKEQQKTGTADAARLKKDLKTMLRSVSEYAERDIAKAEAIFTLKKSQYPGASGLGKMKDAVAALIELADQEVTLDGDALRVSSEYAHRASERLAKPAGEALKGFLGENLTDRISGKLDGALRSIRTEKQPVKTAESKKPVQPAPEKKAQQKDNAEKAAQPKPEKALSPEEQYEADLARWIGERAEAKKKREAYIAQRIAEEQKKVEEPAAAKRDEVVPAAEKKIKELEKQKADAEAKLASLGFFRFGEKSTLKQTVKDLSQSLIEAKNERETAMSKYRDALSDFKSRTEEMELSLRRDALRKYPIPSRPVDPSKPGFGSGSPLEVGTRAIREAIYDYMEAFGGKYTVTELQMSVPALSELSNQRVSKLVNELVAEGRVTREETDRAAYFRLR